MSAERSAGGGDSAGERESQERSFRSVLTLSGETVGTGGDALPPVFAAAASAMIRDTERAARHLGLARWETIVIEGAGGVLGFAPSGPEGARFAVLGLAADTPLGAAQRSVLRFAAEGAPE